jgi:hypothetical protein
VWAWWRKQCRLGRPGAGPARRGRIRPPKRDSPTQAALPVLPGLPAPAEPPEATQGRDLADHVQIGFAYQMHLDGEWHKVRLSHVSPARSFFIFTTARATRRRSR